MDINDSYGIKSSFQIVPGGRYVSSQAFLDQFRERGFDLCVQDWNHDGRLFDERGEFRRRAELINRFAQEQGAKGFRSAVLYRNPEWLEELDFAFDMSMPNVAHLDPQRGGCCTVTPYFIGNLVELPLTTIQDYTLFYILKERSVDLWRQQIELILAKNGLVALLVHPDYILESDTLATYKNLLDLLNEFRVREDLWFALPGDVAEWWQQRNEMTIIENCGSWKIAGEGAERARLAFARVVDGHLVYELADEVEGKSFSAPSVGLGATNMVVQ